MLSISQKKPHLKIAIIFLALFFLAAFLMIRFFPEKNPHYPFPAIQTYDNSEIIEPLFEKNDFSVA